MNNHLEVGFSKIQRFLLKLECQPEDVTQADPFITLLGPEKTLKLISSPMSWNLNRNAPGRNKRAQRNLQRAIRNYFELLSHNFHHGDLLKLFRGASGHRHLLLPVGTYEYLRTTGVSREEIIQIVNSHGGHNNLSGLKEHYSPLRQLGFTHQNLISMISFPGAWKCLEFVHEHFQELQNKGWDVHKIVHKVKEKKQGFVSTTSDFIKNSSPGMSPNAFFPGALESLGSGGVPFSFATFFQVYNYFVLGRHYPPVSNRALPSIVTLPFITRHALFQSERDVTTPECVVVPKP